MAFERADQRKANELRRILIESGHLEADGSAKLSIGDTVVETSIVGPKVSLKHCDHSKITEAHIDVTVQSEQGTVTALEMKLKCCIESVFSKMIMKSKYPSTTIYIHCQVICDSGCLLMALLNCVSVAMLDSGIDCTTFPVSVSFGVIDNGTLIFDPTYKEIEMIQTFGTLSFSTSLAKVAPNCNVDGSTLMTGKLKRQRRKSNNLNDESSKRRSNQNNQNEVQAMDLVFSDITSTKFDMQILQKMLKECKVACYTLQFFIKRHFVQMMIALPSIYVQQKTG